VKLPRTVPVALLITAPIVASLQLMKFVPAYPGGTPFAKAMISYGGVTLLSAGAMAAFGEGRWGDFGFRKIAGPWWRLALYALLLGTASGIIIKLGPGRSLDESFKSFAPGQLPLFLLVASVVEELCMRGWLQGFLEPLRPRVVKLGPVRLSVPVLTGALVFGAWHLPALSFDVWTGANMVVFTTLLGALAGTSRERTGSLVPAIATHVAGNLGGIVAGIIMMIATGKVPQG
jgi:membrane protease YdiL (CAAX protease family)